MDTAHFSKPLVQNLSAQSSLTRAGALSNNQYFDWVCLLGKHSTSTIHSCQGNTASCNCTGHPLGREDGRPVRKPQVLGTRHGYVYAVKNSTVMMALQLCKSSCSETLLYLFPQHHPWNRLGHPHHPTPSHHHLYQNIFWRHLPMFRETRLQPPTHQDRYLGLVLAPVCNREPVHQTSTGTAVWLIKRTDSLWQICLPTIKFQLLLSDSSIFSLLTSLKN